MVASCQCPLSQALAVADKQHDGQYEHNGEPSAAVSVSNDH